MVLRAASYLTHAQNKERFFIAVALLFIKDETKYLICGGEIKAKSNKSKDLRFDTTRLECKQMYFQFETPGGRVGLSSPLDSSIRQLSNWLEFDTARKKKAYYVVSN